MMHPDPLHLNHASVSRRWSRRAMLQSWGAAGIALVGASIGRWDALGAPVVRVAPPQIVRSEECRVTVLVAVTLAGLARGNRYLVYGDLMESDAPDDEPDACGALEPSETQGDSEERQRLELRAHLRTADLGLVKGVGPARDEAFSPNLVELFARIWLRDLATSVEQGPWDSPLRVAVASSALAWEHPGGFPGRELLVPRGGIPPAARDGVRGALPPQACIS